MNKVLTCFILAIVFSIIHNLYLFNHENDDEDGEYVRENDYLSQSNDLNSFGGLDEDGGEKSQGSSSMGALTFLSQLLWTGHSARVKRRIWFTNETLPIPPEDLPGGNGTGNSTVGGGGGNGTGNGTSGTKPKGYSIIKLLNKNYTIIKEKYLVALANGWVDINGVPIPGKYPTTAPPPGVAPVPGGTPPPGGGTPAPPGSTSKP